MVLRESAAANIPASGIARYCRLLLMAKPRPRIRFGSSSARYESTATISAPTPMAATKRQRQIEEAVDCALITRVAAAYQTSDHVKIGLRPMVSANFEKSSAPRKRPLKLPNPNVARSPQ